MEDCNLCGERAQCPCSVSRTVVLFFCRDCGCRAEDLLDKLKEIGVTFVWGDELPGLCSDCGQEDDEHSASCSLREPEPLDGGLPDPDQRLFDLAADMARGIVPPMESDDDD